jgi:hypothetical protein
MPCSVRGQSLPPGPPQERTTVPAVSNSTTAARHQHILLAALAVVGVAGRWMIQTWS